jgi:hypothetical protein
METTMEGARLRERVLRTLLRHGRQNEGRLSAKVRRSMFEESWNKCIDGLLAEGLVVAAPTGYGRARALELTSSGTAEAERTRAQSNASALAEIEATARA